MALHQAGGKALKNVTDQPQGFGLTDIYFTLFRRWKLILGFALLGIVASTCAFLVIKPVYTSEAKILVRFVMEKRSISPTGSDATVVSPDRYGENVMSSEVEIFNSFDLALQVAQEFGPERILAKVGGGTNKVAAAAVLKEGMVAINPKRSNIILVSFTHPDPEIVQPILTKFVAAYQEKHVEIHRQSGVLDDVLKRQREALRMSLTQTESALVQIQTNQGILSVEDSKRTLQDRISKLSEQLLSAETELAEAKVSLAFLTPTQGVAAASQSISNSAPSAEGSAANLNPGSAPLGPTNVAAAFAVIPQDRLDAYRALTSELELVRKHEKDLLKQYTEAHPAVKRVRNLIVESDRQVQELRKAFPNIQFQMSITPASSSSSGGYARTSAEIALNPAEAIQRETSRIGTLQAKIATLRDYLTQSKREASELVDADIKIGDLKRTKDLQEAKYRYYQQNLDQAAVDEALGPGKVMNLSLVQAPATAAKDSGQRLKLSAAALVIPFAFALLLAFILDLFLDQSIRRPSEVEKKAGVPLFISIPENAELASPKARKLLPAGGEPTAVKAPSDSPAAAGEVMPVVLPTVTESAELQPLFETLRDRLVAFFDAHQLTHKPKLLGITGCHAEAGVTTVVAGLAASLSNSGDGNVLVVDMKEDGGAVQQFFRGKPQLGLVDVLEGSRRNEAQVQDNLFVVSEQDVTGNLPKILHKRFLGLLPKLKLSSYDYILFDLPPMSQTSIAPRVARFMDMVLVVAESERTNAAVLRQSAQILSDTGTHVGAVLNRTRQYVPESLSQELP
ncbi:MAG: hypothetical protein JNN07_07400 [Verrucomicrobiales bacterium]|nr:hypothetical protein [Verrucomicrobiales bacterium]